ncbi:MAG: DUF2306 domain-containing protein [Thalassovita sp.]
MSLSPLLAAPLPIQFHAVAALALIPLTITIFLIPRGSSLHKKLGWAWVLGMMIVATSSFWISELRTWGAFGPIHLLSIYTIGALVFAIISIRRRKVKSHRRAMLGLVYGALIGAGLFTLLPGRIMNQVIFGA